MTAKSLHDTMCRCADPKVLTAGFHRARPGWISPVLNRDIVGFDVWYVATGTGAVQVDGGWHEFHAGDLLVLKPGCLYQRERTGNGVPFQIYYTHLWPFGDATNPLNRKLAQAWPLCMSLAHRPELLRIAGNLFEAFVTRRRNDSLTVKGLALQLLDIVFEELRGPIKAGGCRAHPGVLRAKTLIEGEYTRALTLQDIASRARLSVSHLSALFVRFMGAPPMEYLLRIRLSEAKLRLSQGQRVKEVAHAVGFASPHYFARFFRKRTGLSPREFTARHCREYRAVR